MFSMEFYLVINCLLATIVSCIIRYYYPATLKFTMPNILTIIYVICIGPIIEESLFRHTLIDCTNHLPYYVEMNAILFSLVHLLNFTFDTNKYLVFAQFIFAFYLGYYLVILDNVYMGMLVHSLYNAFIIIVMNIVVLLFFKSPQPIAKFTPLLNISYNPLKPSKSCTNIRKPYYQNIKTKYISHKEIPKDLSQLFEKYDEIIQNKEQKTIDQIFYGHLKNE